MGDREKSDRKNRVPLVLNNGTILPRKCNTEDIATYYVEGVRRPVLLVPASDEVRKEYVREGERQKKQRQRQMKRAREKSESFAPPLSLDSLKEDGGFDTPDSSIDFELAELQILFEQLVALIEKKNHRYGEILRLTREGLSQRDIADRLGKSQTTIKEQQREALKLIRELYRE